MYLMRSMFVGVDCVKMTCNVRIWGDFGTVNVPPKSFRESPFIFQVVRYVLCHIVIYGLKDISGIFQPSFLAGMVKKFCAERFFNLSRTVFCSAPNGMKYD